MKIVALTTHIAGYVDCVQQAAPDAEIFEAPDDDAMLREVVDAEILFSGIFGDGLLDAAAQLKWVQVSSAGVEWMPKEAIARKGWLVTNAAGIHAIPVAETGDSALVGGRETRRLDHPQPNKGRVGEAARHLRAVRKDGRRDRNGRHRAGLCRTRPRPRDAGHRGGREPGREAGLRG